MVWQSLKLFKTFYTFLGFPLAAKTLNTYGELHLTAFS